MGLFSKKEKVPEIPAVPTLPEVPQSSSKKELPELPSFPSTPQNENMNQEMVKSAVADSPSEENEINVNIPEGLNIKEESSNEQMIPSKPIEPISTSPESSNSNIPQKPLELNASIPNKSIAKHTEPIFVRIDKFQSAQKNFENIKDKVKDIESVLGKVKDVRSGEEKELKGWIEDIEKIKVRLAEVDADIFDKI